MGDLKGEEKAVMGKVFWAEGTAYAKAQRQERAWSFWEPRKTACVLEWSEWEAEGLGVREVDGATLQGLECCSVRAVGTWEGFEQGLLWSDFLL